MLTPAVLGPMIAGGFVLKFKRDDFREKQVNCDCCGSTPDDAVAALTNQPAEEF